MALTYEKMLKLVDETKSILADRIATRDNGGAGVHYSERMWNILEEENNHLIGAMEYQNPFLYDNGLEGWMEHVWVIARTLKALLVGEVDETSTYYDEERGVAVYTGIALVPVN